MSEKLSLERWREWAGRAWPPNAPFLLKSCLHHGDTRAQYVPKCHKASDRARVLSRVPSPMSRAAMVAAAWISTVSLRNDLRELFVDVSTLDGAW